MKKIIFIGLLTLGSIAWAQTKIIPTGQITITGKVKKELMFTLADLATYTTTSIPDIGISSHTGEVKNTVKSLKGIPFKNILDKIEFSTDKPKELSEFYLTFVASDGYKVVFSWNEIFNTDVGNHLFIITEKNGKQLKDFDDRILTICSSDFKTGRRYVKALEKIVVGRTE